MCALPILRVVAGPSSGETDLERPSMNVARSVCGPAGGVRVEVARVAASVSGGHFWSVHAATIVKAEATKTEIQPKK